MKNLLRNVRSALRRRRHAHHIPARKDSIPSSDTQDDEQSGAEKVAVVPTTAELASTSTLAAITEDTLLVSWLLVLLRSQDNTQFNFEWAFCSGEDGASGEPVSSPLLHIEARVDGGSLQARPVWHSEDMLPFTVTRHVENLSDSVKLCLSNPRATIQSLLGPTRHDLEQIWGWNHVRPTTYDCCMHDIISKGARQRPDKEAIASWDGNLTYGQIDQYSTYMAHLLQTQLGVQPHDFVPVCFEKSRWTVVAVLAVMKAGATMVLMDPTLPLVRLQNMAVQVGAKAMVTSRKQHDLSTSILPDGKLVTVEQEAFAALPNTPTTLPALTPVSPDTLMYIIFTSGSTGTPKGVKISHRTYSSSAFPRAQAVGYTENSRVLDFASYAFDVSIDSMLLTLANGGCLCIPSDEDRLNDINQVMRDMRVNYAGITPSMARILDHDVIASLSGLGLGGEAAAASDVNRWGQQTRIIIGYGPCECTIGCTVNSSAAKGRDYISIGPGNGAAMWIVDPDNHEVLMPLGAVGELLVDGPIVGQGYLNDPDKTAAAFIEDPCWLTAGHGTFAGRKGCLYKTGDLGRYDPDGSGEIVFVGRKDTQVKLRGQRVELGEIESQLQARLPAGTTVIAEVIVPGGSAKSQPTLVVFVAPQSTHGQDAELESAQLSNELRKVLTKADAEIGEVLPRYMVPTAYIPVGRIPTLVSGKTDRKRLRQFGATADLRRLTAAEQAAPTTEVEVVDRLLNDMEERLRQVWAATLTVDAAAIRLHDNFFALGGDSLAAMRLSTVCRDQGLDLSVLSTFGHPTLAAMAAVVVDLSDSQAVPEEQRQPFSLITQPVKSAILQTSQICGTDPSAIEDIYPCTPTQESLFTFSIKSTEAYIAQRVALIPSHIGLDAWRSAWDQVVAVTPILRSRLVQLGDHASLGQAVLKGGIQWRHAKSELAAYLEADRNDRMSLGRSLARYAIIKPPSTPEKRYMVWTLHHAVYDGWSEPLVLAQVRDSLLNPGQPTPPPSTTMADFVQHVTSTDPATMRAFWETELCGATGPQFPRVPSRDFLPTPSAMLTHYIPLPASTPNLPFTLATLVRGAWALVSSNHSQNPDVVFGETLTGRDIPLRGVASVVGPLIATVPIRVRVDRAATVADYLAAIQRGVLGRAPFQHMGMQNIRRVSRDAQYACEAPAGLVIQPAPEYGVGAEMGFEIGDVVKEAVHFNPYPLMLACGIEKGGLRVCASFDSSLVGVEKMGRVLAQLEMVCLELGRDLGRAVGEVPCVGATELGHIWSWNREPPLSLDASSGRLQAAKSVKPGSVFNPQAAVPWVCGLDNSAVLAPIGCPGELWLEGAFLAGDGVVESPAWLLAGTQGHAGRAGKTQPTGDIVTLQHDGSLVFLGRKGESSSGQRRSGDVAELESHFEAYLPPSVRTVATSTGSRETGLVVFLENLGGPKDSTIQVLQQAYTIPPPDKKAGSAATVCAAIPADLAAALKRLDKFVQNSLASHLVPSAYVVVDKLPTKGDEVDRGLLQQLAAQLPGDILSQLCDGFRKAWAASLATTTSAATTTAEDILRSSWAGILGLEAHEIDTDDNFFRLGGDSVLAMKLVSRLRAQGHGLTVADIFRHMRLGDAAKVLKVDQFKVPAEEKAAAPTTSYQPLSLLGAVDQPQFVADNVRPKLANPGWTIQDVYPVTDSQALDIKATIHPPRTSIQYTMLYADSGFDSARLAQACQGIVQAHDILRTVFVDHDSTFFQVVVKDLDIPVIIRQADTDNLEQSAQTLSLAHVDSDGFRLGAPFFHIFLLQGKDNKGECLVLGFSHAQYDGVSLPLVLRDLEALYTGSAIAPSAPFSSYLSHTLADRPARSAAVSYWSTLLSGSAVSILPGQTSQEQVSTSEKAIFRTAALPTPCHPPPVGITTATLLTAGWAVILARRLRTPDVLFGGITSGRVATDSGDTAVVMGPCYQFTPVRVRFERQWTARDLLAAVQQQAAESLAHDFVGGFGAGGREGFVDSVVHHQDWEEFESMPFAGGEVKVGIANPHGDAARPMN
ncbi:hypothetical protein C8A05DRAFT_35970 [Staphylotrichum tortipilum]|uniref:Carrier domain-containing protein n=1 Tax=Staphylotrichum tortipilum TaxID=2831512 RepID=A0AAN6MHT3_9PEZI|nr:hypothetical protein C8A05DRAFT_35970 [Staphylotrichum longicolle]